MRYEVRESVICELSLDDEKPFKLGGFTLYPDPTNKNVIYVGVHIDANTEESAKSRAHRIISNFLCKLTLLDDSKYILDGSSTYIITQGSQSVTVAAQTQKVMSYVVKGGKNLKNKYLNSFSKKNPHKTPLRLYRDATNSNSLFQKYMNFYKILEHYFGSRNVLTRWIKQKEKTVQMELDEDCNKITVYQWIRHGLSHAKRGRSDKKVIKPLLESNIDHVATVNKHLPGLQKLVKIAIREKEDLDI